jgi:hypothetical protein
VLEEFVAAITSKLAGPILGALLLLAIGGSGFLGFKLWSVNNELADTKADVTRLTLDNGTLRANQATLKGSVAAQNASVDSIATAAELSAARAGQAKAEAERDAAIHNQRAAAIAATKASQPNDLCASAEALIQSVYSSEAK